MILYWSTVYFAYGLSKLLFGLRVSGCENVPRTGGFILASNHTSLLDPILLGCSSRRMVSFMAKDSLFRNPIFSAYLHRLNAFPLKRESADRGALKEALRRLAQGHGLVIFPSGTRAPAEGIAESTPVHGGIGFIAAKSGAPVVPVYIHGSDRALSCGSRRLAPARITMDIARPISYSAEESYEAFARRTLEAVRRIAQIRCAPRTGLGRVAKISR